MRMMIEPDVLPNAVRRAGDWGRGCLSNCAEWSSRSSGEALLRAVESVGTDGEGGKRWYW